MGKRCGKSAKEMQRRPAQLAERERVMIVTEGSKTEPDYFCRLTKELGLTSARVVIVGDVGSAPTNIIEYTKKRLKDDPDFEHVFLVFDRDRHSSYNAAITKANALKPRNAPKNRRVEPIPSIPRLEIWYFFHVSGSRKPYPIGEGQRVPVFQVGGAAAEPVMSGFRDTPVRFCGLAGGPLDRELKTAMQKVRFCGLAEGPLRPLV